VNDFLGVVAAGTCEYGDAAVGLRHDQFHDAHLFRVGQRWNLACCAAWHEEMDAGVDLPARQPRHRRFVERAVAAERRDQRGSASCERSSHAFLRSA
jgi:hypothetical protein